MPKGILNDNRNLVLNQCSNTGYFDMISASHHSFDTRDLTQLSTFASSALCHTCEIDTRSRSTVGLMQPNLHDLMPTLLRENNEIHCDTHKLRKLWNLIDDTVDIFLKITF